MELWDEVMGPSKPEFDRLSPVGRLKVAVGAIKWTIGSRPIADAEAAQLVADIVTHLESAAAQGLAAVSMTTEFDERIDAVMERVGEPGVSSIVMACVRCFTRESELPGDYAFNALGSCYNAVVEQEFSGPFIELEDEEGNPRCREAIAVQQELLAQAR